MKIYFDWPIKVDYEDLLIIKELEKNGKTTLTDISKTVGIPLENLKYHFREHVLKRGLIEDFQVEIYRFPFPVSEILFFRFDFHSAYAKFSYLLKEKPI